MTNTPTIKFCPSCGAPRHGNAVFCGACGSRFPAPVGHASPAAVPKAGSKGAWRVIAGKALPEASQLFDLAKGAPAKGKARSSASVIPPSKGKRLWGSTFWVALTQAADLVTRSMGSVSPDDPYVSLRLGVAAAVAVFSLTLSPLPRLRSVLVRLGVVAMALLQGQGLVPVVQTAVLDPSLIGALAPNLAAQATGIAALVQLFIAARARRP